LETLKSKMGGKWGERYKVNKNQID
jgi:hypothetical protein